MKKKSRMNKIFLPLFFLFSTTFSSYSQTISPYETNWAVDGAWIGAGVGLNVLGLLAIKNKEPLTREQLNSLSKDDVFTVDRWAAGNFSKRADNLSYYPFYGSFTLPIIMMLLDENQREDTEQISVLFVETMATTGALFTMSAGYIHRSRPLVYNTALPDEERMDNDAQRSFFAGHVAATAAATFFAAKVFHDFNPASRATPYVWTAATLIPTWVGYLRIKSGKHFITDSLIGFGVGAMAGILIPEIHKKENTHISLTPVMGFDYQGIGLNYVF